MNIYLESFGIFFKIGAFTKNGTDFIMDKYAVGYSARSERLKRKGAIL